MAQQPDNPATAEQIAKAKEMYQTHNCEIDVVAQVSDADNGVWVTAWVYLPNEE